MSGPHEQRPTDDELRFMAEMGMTEVEPGRWLSGWKGTDPDLQERIDSQGSKGQEHLDLLRAGRVQNEFDLEQNDKKALFPSKKSLRTSSMNMDLLWQSSSQSRRPVLKTSKPLTKEKSSAWSRRPWRNMMKCFLQT